MSMSKFHCSQSVSLPTLVSAKAAFVRNIPGNELEGSLVVRVCPEHEAPEQTRAILKQILFDKYHNTRPSSRGESEAGQQAGVEPQKMGERANDNWRKASRSGPSLRCRPSPKPPRALTPFGTFGLYAERGRHGRECNATQSLKRRSYDK
ncbi:hypothetical protein CLCR_07618 [Cladophialophora carrionii]|uniref:Uncharacterized protein n=1 Tax=Cladophialophora carrionii TaxID=86049 RepID=A0A1C1CMJ8_9EURO|nr:hypothetical protein CLCR_07618 [Cladophialophora carrionii]